VRGSPQLFQTTFSTAKKQMAGSDPLWQQPSTCWSMEMCYPSRSFWADATVPADYAMTTTTIDLLTKVWIILTAVMN